MSDELDSNTGLDCLEDFSGVEGDGLCEGEVACESELSWRFSCLGVCERVADDLREARSTRGSGGRRSRSLRAQKRARSAMRGGGEGGKPA
jgi:hypothetical protein